jgi:UvrB/uvrC motif.
MQELRTAGERLGKLDLAKKQAIQQEDFTRAKRKKNEMEQFRNEVYLKLRISELLEPDGVGICISKLFITNRYYLYFKTINWRNVTWKNL